MKIEIDFVEIIEKMPMRKMITKSGKQFYQQQLNIKSKNGTTTLIAKSYNKDLIKEITGGDLDKKEKKVRKGIKQKS
jgi:hypothetical protein